MPTTILATNSESYLSLRFGAVQPADPRQPCAAWLAGDFNVDGKPDLLWVNARVPSAFWRLFAAGVLQRFSRAGWHIVQWRPAWKLVQNRGYVRMPVVADKEPEYIYIHGALDRTLPVELPRPRGLSSALVTDNGLHLLCDVRGNAKNDFISLSGARTGIIRDEFVSFGPTRFEEPRLR